MQPPYRVGWTWLQELAEQTSDYVSGVADFDDIPDDAVLEADSSSAVDTTAKEAVGSKRDKALRALNNKFAIVPVGNDVVVLQEREGTQPLLLSETAFRRLLAPYKLDNRTPIAKAWIEWLGRREYSGGIVFKPGEKEQDNEYNLFRGWEIEPSKEGSCNLFLRHIRDVVCGGNEADTVWVLDWLAHIFQYPQEKPETVLALQGVPGAGKSIVGKVLKRLLGDALLATAEASQVTGRFNGHLANCLVLQAEEAFWYKDYHAERVLKHLATGEYLAIERKGVDLVNMRNFTRLLLTTNKDAVWPTSIDDRRLAIFRVSPAHARDRTYFAAMLDQLEDGGYGRLLDFFLSREIDRDRLFDAPRTEALEEQAAYSLSPEEEWYLELLLSGELPFSNKTEVRDGGAARVPVSVLYDSYAESVPRRYEPMNEKAFGYFLRNLPGETTEQRVLVTSGRRGRRVRSRWYELPPLPHCRKAYSKRGRAAIQAWDEPEQEWSIESEGMSF